MAYDKEKFDLIQQMQLGDLVHVMMTEYVRPPSDDQAAYMQNIFYFWAYERMNEMLTGDDADEQPEGWEAVQP